MKHLFWRVAPTFMLGMSDCLIGQRKYKKQPTSSVRTSGFFLFITLSFFIPLFSFWDLGRMRKINNGYRIRDRFLTWEETSSTRVFEWFNHSLSTQPIDSSCPWPANKERIMKSSCFSFGSQNIEHPLPPYVSSKIWPDCAITYMVDRVG